MARDTVISKFMSLVLRHEPKKAGLVLDANGWTDLGALVAAVGNRFGATEADVRRVVEENAKKRFTIDDGRIRAAQGHSVAVDLVLAQVMPPATLFHGTKVGNVPSILAEGLHRGKRHHVHLSPDRETASIVAKRRAGEDVILVIEAGRMAGDGVAFFRSENGVWLTDHVAPQYVSVPGEDP
ncbi:MAG: RNA--NAD 2'-phosphotransferase [Mesorhizobium amorphae]|nr:MAG: RNA--NAD 2'-phosphotransferase [Mesorhizobium amorphae]